MSTKAMMMVSRIGEGEGKWRDNILRCDFANVSLSHGLCTTKAPGESRSTQNRGEKGAALA